MLRLGWARVGDRIHVDDPIARLCLAADRATMLAIARRLLRSAPPSWLFAAASGQGLAREFIPADELADLEWLEPDLERLLLEVASALRAERDESRLKQIGDAAELYLMAAFARAGLAPRHAALWSDPVGYDIELPGPPIQASRSRAAKAIATGQASPVRSRRAVATGPS